MEPKPEKLKQKNHREPMNEDKCYLCGKDEMPEKDSDKIINCPNCPPYSITHGAWLFYIRPEVPDYVRLNDKDKKKLHQDIQKEYKKYEDTNKHVQIDEARIIRVTGKRSVNINYK